jgi:hypothetical protein
MIYYTVMRIYCSSSLAIRAAVIETARNSVISRDRDRS